MRRGFFTSKRLGKINESPNTLGLSAGFGVIAEIGSREVVRYKTYSNQFLDSIATAVSVKSVKMDSFSVASSDRRVTTTGS